MLSACGSSVPVIKPFKMDIQQGNVVSSKMLLQLRPGMTKSQVKFVMGSPLIIDSFHTNRWDYFYQLRQAGKVVEQRRVILDFEKELLKSVRGDVVAQGNNGDAVGLSNESDADAVRRQGKRVEKEGVFENLKFWNRDDDVLEKPAVKPITSKPDDDKGLLDSLKFWKKDAKTELKKPVAPKKPDGLELKELRKPALTDTKKQVESVITDTTEAIKPATSPKIEPATISPLRMEPSESQPLNIEPLEEKAPSLLFLDPQTDNPSNADPEALKRLQTNEKKILQPNDSEAVMNKSERQIFRLDKNLSNYPNENSLESAGQATDSAKSQSSQIKTPKVEISEPHLFDRMLEKIGF